MATEGLVKRGDHLGWDPFRELLAGFAATTVGHDRVGGLDPAATVEEIRARLRDTAEARQALRVEGPPPWGGLRDIRPVLVDAAPEGAALDGAGLVRLGETLRAAERLAAYGQRIRAAAPTLAAGWAALPLPATLGTRLEHDLDPDGRLRDEASPRLRTLRRQVTELRADLQARLERLLDSPVLAGALQERYVTVRHGRYVLPIKDDARRGVRGIVHDRSLSGATVFVEPEAVVELNNQLTQQLLLERAETERVLRELTGLVRQVLPELTALTEGLGALDAVFARAALADRLDAVEPAVGEGGDVELLAARHPLLEAQRWAAPADAPRPPVVPMDLVLPADRPGLVISGPNAGGKTVALETLGLLVLMAQAGCHLPAAPGCRLPVCDRVLAVIGDDQSLAQNLSTFSSFVGQVREILEVAGPRTLVLLDELGAGTDPAEGAALGAAILEALLARGARVVVTTHLEPLKVFAQVEPRLQNATVAFDADRLAPTFRLEYGRPGPSYALAIGERLGLPAPLIARARLHLTETTRRLEALLADLTAREREAGLRLAEAARREAEGAASLARARHALADADREAAARRRAAEAEARALLADARRRVGHELDRLKAEEATRRDAQLAYQRLRDAERLLAAPGPAAASAAPEEPPVAGTVEVRGLGLRGRVVGEQDGLVTVQAGRLTVRVARSEVEPSVAGPGRPPGLPAPRATVSLPTREDVPRELHLRGLTTDEARAAVDKFLDDAALAGHGVVRLVHGKGTGALKRAIDRDLRAHPLVNAFRVAPPHEGGGGVTIVELAEGDR